MSPSILNLIYFYVVTLIILSVGIVGCNMSKRNIRTTCNIYEVSQGDSSHHLTLHKLSRERNEVEYFSKDVYNQVETLNNQVTDKKYFCTCQSLNL